VLRGPIGVGREYSFSGRRVTRSWPGELSAVQSLPPPNDLPSVPTASSDRSFILEFPLMKSNLDRLNNHRGLRKHRDLTLLLNVLLGRGKILPGRAVSPIWNLPVGFADHCWTLMKSRIRLVIRLLDGAQERSETISTGSWTLQRVSILPPHMVAGNTTINSRWCQSGY
jgi:hypothetical protein